jgi:hypothetical protein
MFTYKYADSPVVFITSHLLFDRVKMLRINDIVKMYIEGYCLPSQHV